MSMFFSSKAAVDEAASHVFGTFVGGASVDPLDGGSCFDDGYSTAQTTCSDRSLHCPFHSITEKLIFFGKQSSSIGFGLAKIKPLMSWGPKLGFLRIHSLDS